MKKYISVLMLVGFLVPFASHAALMGFSADNGLWDQTGKQLYTCFPDIPSTCVGLDNQIYYKSDLVNGITTKPVSSAPDTKLIDTSFPILNPIDNQPIVGGIPLPAISIQPDPSFTATSIPANGSQVVLGKWILSNSSDSDIKILHLLINFNFVGNIQSLEGFKNVGFLNNGAQLGGSVNFTNNNFSLGGTFVFTIPANSSSTLQIKGDSVFSNLTNISSVTSSIQLNSTSGDVTATSTTLTLTH